MSSMWSTWAACWIAPIAPIAPIAVHGGLTACMAEGGAPGASRRQQAGMQRQQQQDPVAYSPLR
jgi:hypothetical protein